MHLALDTTAGAMPAAHSWHFFLKYSWSWENRYVGKYTKAHLLRESWRLPAPDTYFILKGIPLDFKTDL